MNEVKYKRSINPTLGRAFTRIAELFAFHVANSYYVTHDTCLVVPDATGLWCMSGILNTGLRREVWIHWNAYRSLALDPRDRRDSVESFRRADIYWSWWFTNIPSSETRGVGFLFSPLSLRCIAGCTSLLTFTSVSPHKRSSNIPRNTESEELSILQAEAGL